MPASHPHVDAELNYTKRTGERPVTYAYPRPDGLPERGGVPDPQRVRIYNARRLGERFELDRHGFELRRQASALDDFDDEARIRSVYYAEAEALVRKATGASKVVIFDHTLRDGRVKKRGESGPREPVRRVHNDQTFLSGPRRVRDHLPAEEAEARLARRFAIINLWRPLEPVAETPLALCDARTIAPRDLIPSDLVYRDKVGETYLFAFNPEHRWLYFPELRPDEYLLLKIYDARAEGTARLTAHSAFDDPSSPAEAPPRRSIELRTLAFFD